MDSQNGSLQNLHDIITPPAVPFWPLGSGAYLLLLALLVALFLLGYVYLQNYTANQYRRTGLELLQSAATVHDVSVILKRVALAVFPRERVASLYGEEWYTFLADVCPGCTLQGLQMEAESAASRDLIQAAAVWIRKHKVREKG